MKSIPAFTTRLPAEEIDSRTFCEVLLDAAAKEIEAMTNDLNHSNSMFPEPSTNVQPS